MNENLEPSPIDAAPNLGQKAGLFGMRARAPAPLRPILT
jgi:hypothetical protein